MHDLVQARGYLDLALFVTLAAATIRLWWRRRREPGLWAMLTFLALAVIEVLGEVAPTHPRGFGELAVQRLEIALLLLVPYLLFRFTTAFRAPGRVVLGVLGAMTLTMLVWTFVQPTFPAAGQPHPPSFVAYVVAFVVHWTVLSAFAAWRLWRAGAGQPSVSRRRMRLLSLAAAILTLALILTATTSSADSPVEAAARAAAFLAAVGFLLGLTPPALLRLAWRRPEQRRLQDAVERLVTLATSSEEVAERVLPPMAAIVGARRVELRDRAGQLVGVHEASAVRAPDAARDQLELELAGGARLRLWTTPYAPFFGEEELELLQALGALTGIALDRVRLFVREHDARVELERANEVMANFISLAAHELRTPVTAVHGFVHTLNHLGERLTPEQRGQVERALEQQTVRMVSLVEQLLDLSRLDADAIPIVPRRFRVRERVQDVVAAAVPDRAGAVTVEVPEGLEVLADATAFDRIVTNLITNAFRYGTPPVTVRAEQTDRHFRVIVEDRGRGVPPEFVPDLFERFTRSDASRERSSGTGLGLAIARSYARAHGGDLLYEDAEPHGARFRFVLPAGAASTTS